MRAVVLAILLATLVALAAPGRVPPGRESRAAAQGGGADVVTAPSPPVQPGYGPGGHEYPYGAVRRRVGGTGAEQYWIFEPAEPAPTRAPVVVFLHGWGAMVPDPYLGWIQHLVRRGHIVIYPRYQETLATPPPAMTDHAEAAVKAALETLVRDGGIQPDLEYVAFVGHSLGGVIAANLAARAAPAGLPQPKALMAVEPGDPPRTALAFARGQPSILEDYGRIARQTLMLVVVGDRDRTVGEETARIIFRDAGAAPA
ncbi:MAG: alpha/beta fold hydrolase, partial [Bacillota bacterium]